MYLKYSSYILSKIDIPYYGLLRVCLMYVLQSLRSKTKTNHFWLIIGCIGALVFGIYRVIIGKDLPWNADLSILAMSFMSFEKWCREQKNYRESKINEI